MRTRWPSATSSIFCYKAFTNGGVAPQGHFLLSNSQARKKVVSHSGLVQSVKMH